MPRHAKHALFSIQIEIALKFVFDRITGFSGCLREELIELWNFFVKHNPTIQPSNHPTIQPSSHPVIQSSNLLMLLFLET
jgi:hypothetical protein